MELSSEETGDDTDGNGPGPSHIRLKPNSKGKSKALPKKGKEARKQFTGASSAPTRKQILRLFDETLAQMDEDGFQNLDFRERHRRPAQLSLQVCTLATTLAVLSHLYV